MAYIGREPVIGNFVKLDSITVVNGQAAYTMNNGGSAFTAYDNVNQFLVSLNGILQSPTDSFTVSGSTLTFASNLSTGDVIDFVIVLGNSLDIGTPSDNTVTAAKLNNDIISGQTELTDVPAATDEILLSDAGNLKRLDFSVLSSGMAVKKITVNDNITTSYSGLTGSIVTDHTLTDYNVTHTALSTSNKLAFFINIPYSNAVKPNLGITDFKINDGSSDIKTGLFYNYNGSTGSGELSIHAFYFDHTPASTNSITYTCKASIYRPSGSNTATIGLSSHPGRMMVVEY